MSRRKNVKNQKGKKKSEITIKVKESLQMSLVENENLNKNKLLKGMYETCPCRLMK